MASPLPPPLDDTTVSDPLECPPLLWGLIGCGRVSHDFCQALKHVKTASVVACATATSLERAQSFASKHGIDAHYGSYDELLEDEKVQIVYVGNVHAFRRAIGEKCLRANKHVLLEKPFACTYEDAEFLISLAKERNLFLMEGMWTRFFPAVEQARRLVFEDKVLGSISSVQTDFCFNAADSEEYPTSFVYNRKLGGGASLLVGPYPIAAAVMFFEGEPNEIKVCGQVDPTTGVDLQASISLSFPATSEVQPATDDSNTEENTPKLPGSGIASISYGLVCESEEVTTAVGTKGRLTIMTPGHCPTRLKVCLKAEGRGAAAETKEYHYPLPEDTPDIIASGGFIYPNSAGFCYEAAAVARCIAAGKIEAPQYTLRETLVEMKMIDQARSQLGFKSVHEA